MKRIAIILTLAIMAGVILTGCDNAPPQPEPMPMPEAVPVQPPEPAPEQEPAIANGESAEAEKEPVSWLSPMISVEKGTNAVSLWDGEYSLHRNETMEYTFRDGDDFNDIEITEDALIAGGAIPVTLRVSYGGDGQHLVRLVAFAYSFFDHGRPARLNAHAPEPNPQEVLVLWRNPVNGHWFNMVQNGVGREAATLGENHNGLVSLRNDNPVYTFLLDNETVETISEMELFIVATTAPTREDEYERSGYSLLFTLELPDLDNHFHGWEIMAACGTMFLVGE